MTDAAENTDGKKGLLAGIGLTLAGLAHFIKPDLFTGITATAFPQDIDKHLKVNGSIETALGVGLIVPPTRKVATIGVLGYVLYLVANVARNR
ncbi:hypothetical protein [Mycolicibacterium sp. CBMA 226]|uniref:hypothetical protein n=1 Tax=Mycolicibacterium sp. CBMA 226 TaxID=2606611 RepID=UPI00130605EE|nr:hypothetical protein [Mycolicibacterium sp. CBMA 226]MUL76597.1 hypothetical protein [Mycolicibacterium sp. CBMA 226]